MTATTVRPSLPKSSYLTWLVVTIVLAIMGLALWGYQLSTGLVITDMRNITSWGLYIVNFMFAVGLSAGGLIIASVPRVFGVLGFKSISKLAVLLAIVCTVLAGVFIIVDMGHPERLLNLVVYGNLTSPLVWDVVVITIYLVVSVIYMWAMIRAEKESGHEQGLFILSCIALVTAILVHSVTAWIFGLQIGRAFWNTALLAPMFISSALVSGLALVLLTTLVLQALGYFNPDLELVKRMSKLLAVFILVDLFLLFCELLTAYYPLEGTGYAAVNLLLSGTGAPMFWFEILGAVLAVVLLLAKGTLTQAVPVGLASLLAIVGVFFKRFNLLMGGFALPNVTNPGVTTGPVSPNIGTMLQGLDQQFAFYFPSFTEWGIMIGVFAFGALILTLGLRYLKPSPAK